MQATTSLNVSDSLSLCEKKPLFMCVPTSLNMNDLLLM